MMGKKIVGKVKMILLQSSSFLVPISLCFLLPLLYELISDGLGELGVAQVFQWQMQVTAMLQFYQQNLSVCKSFLCH